MRGTYTGMKISIHISQPSLQDLNVPISSIRLCLAFASFDCPFNDNRPIVATGFDLDISARGACELAGQEISMRVFLKVEARDEGVV